MAMRYLYVNGSIDSTVQLPDSKIELSPEEFVADANVQAMKAGKIVTIDANGKIKLCDADAGNKSIGVLVNDVAGYHYENIPALASGVVPFMTGGGLIETDQIVDETVTPGALLYCAGGANAGLFTKTASTATGANTDVVGIARTGNSTADKTVRIQLYI